MCLLSSSYSLHVSVVFQLYICSLPVFISSYKDYSMTDYSIKCTCAERYTPTPTHIHAAHTCTCTHTHQTNTQTHTHTCTVAHTHSHTHVHTRTHTHSHEHTPTHQHTHTHTHAHTFTRTHTHTPTHTHTHTPVDGRTIVRITIIEIIHPPTTMKGRTKPPTYTRERKIPSKHKDVHTVHLSKYTQWNLSNSITRPCD